MWQFAPLYPLLYRILQPTFPGCLWQGDPARPEIALTFDDGPHPTYTPQLLDVLDHYPIQVSFFWLGICVQRSPAVAGAVYQRGHWIGLHGYDHRAFTQLSAADLHHSLRKTQGAIATACHLERNIVQAQMRDVRPPNGLFTPQTLKRLRQHQYRPVMWSVVPEDWVQPGVETVIHRILRQVRNGSIIVLHDGLYGGQDVASIVNRLIPRLLEQGYEFKTIQQLWQKRQQRSA